MENTTDEGSALEELKVWVTSTAPALQDSGARTLWGFEMRKIGISRPHAFLFDSRLARRQ
jgi:hypothetical protein